MFSWNAQKDAYAKESNKIRGSVSVQPWLCFRQYSISEPAKITDIIMSTRGILRKEEIK